jgi:hypothetical protein
MLAAPQTVRFRLILQATNQINSQLGPIPSNSIPGIRVGNISMHSITETNVTPKLRNWRDREDIRDKAFIAAVLPQMVQKIDSANPLIQLA